MTIVATYLLTFAAGPAAFWVLARQKPDGTYFAQLTILAITLLIFAFIVPREAGEEWVTWAYFGVIIITVLWLAWILVLALLVLAVRQRMGEGQVARGAFVIGAMATTLPWFGLHIANMMAG